MAYSQKAAVFHSHIHPLNKKTILYFQIKSATIKNNEGNISKRVENAGLQRNVEKEFYFPEKALYSILENENTFIVFYFGDESKKLYLHFG